MTAFTIFNKHGEILRSGSAPGSQLNIQFFDDEYILCESSNPDTQYVVGGCVIDLPERPSAHHSFDYEKAQWVFNESSAWKAIRLKRDQLIGASDWRVARAAERSESLDDQWKSYRQALRDITEQLDPNNIQWPAEPVEGA